MKTKYKIVKEHPLLPAPWMYDSISSIRGNVETELRNQWYIEEIECEDDLVDKLHQLKSMWRHQCFAEIQCVPLPNDAYNRMGKLENEIIQHLSKIDSYKN